MQVYKNLQNVRSEAIFELISPHEECSQCSSRILTNASMKSGVNASSHASGTNHINMNDHELTIIVIIIVAAVVVDLAVPMC